MSSLLCICDHNEFKKCLDDRDCGLAKYCGFMECVIFLIKLVGPSKQVHNLYPTTSTTVHCVRY